MSNRKKRNVLADIYKKFSEDEEYDQNLKEAINEVEKMAREIKRLQDEEHEKQKEIWRIQKSKERIAKVIKDKEEALNSFLEGQRAQLSIEQFGSLLEKLNQLDTEMDE